MRIFEQWCYRQTRIQNVSNVLNNNTNNANLCNGSLIAHIDLAIKTVFHRIGSKHVTPITDRYHYYYYDLWFMIYDYDDLFNKKKNRQQSICQIGFGLGDNFPFMNIFLFLLFPQSLCILTSNPLNSHRLTSFVHPKWRK